MPSEIKMMDVQRASEDLRRRTLGTMPHPLAKFLYLASTRDYNTGLYYHEGLANRFSAEIACEALADCHRETFQQLVMSSVESLVKQLESYIASSQSRPDHFVAVWNGLAPYRVAVPVAADPFTAEFLFSNLKIALAIVEERLTSSPPAQRAA